MLNQVEATAVAPQKKQYAGRPMIIQKRRQGIITQDPQYHETKALLEALIQQYGAKYCKVVGNRKGVNIKFKILNRLYFFSLAESFSASVKKLGDIIKRNEDRLPIAV